MIIDPNACVCGLPERISNIYAFFDLRILVNTKPMKLKGGGGQI